MADMTLEHLLSNAFELHQTGDVNNAKQLYQSALTIDPENLNALQLLGVLNHQLGRHTEAVELLQHAVAVLEKKVERSVEHAVVYNNFGNALRAVGRRTDALAQYRRGLVLDPNLAELHASLADELCAQEDFDGAVASYEAAKRCGQLSSRHLCFLGTACALLKRFTDAETAYRDAIAPLFKLAVSKNKALGKSELFGDPMLCFRPGIVATHAADNKLPVERTNDSHLRNDPSPAIEPYRELMDLMPPNPDLYYLFARALRDIGDSRAAIEIFKLGLELKPDHIANIYDLGVSLVKIGAASLAIPYLERAIELKPNFASFYVELGNALYFIGQTERALDCHRRAFQLQPLRTWNAKLGPAEFSVLAIEGSGVGNTPPQFLLSNGAFDCHFFALLHGMAPDIEMLLRHCDVVVNLISEVDQAQHILPMAVDLIDRLGKPVINHPRKILTTDRETVAERLTGIQLCRTPKTIRCRRERLIGADGATVLAQSGFVFPVLLRIAGTHGGDAFEKLHNSNDVAAFLKINAAQEFYVTEFVDYQSSDGYYRKYRFIFVDGDVFPYHLAICDQWKVHHFRTDMAHHVWMQEEEKAFLEDPWQTFSESHKSVFREIQAAVGLEFFGVDCSLDHYGNFVIFEVNASMLVHDDNAPFQYKTPHCVQIKQAFHAMLSRAAEVKADAAAA